MISNHLRKNGFVLLTNQNYYFSAILINLYQNSYGQNKILQIGLRKKRLLLYIHIDIHPAKKKELKLCRLEFI